MASTEKLLRRHDTTALVQEKVGGLVSRRLGLRIGQRALIALPVVGGGFAAYICSQDVQRARTEKGLAAVCFSAAAATDAVDAIAHFVLAYGLAVHWDHATLHLYEHISLGAAGISIASAIAGELVSQHPHLDESHHHPSPAEEKTK